jgi:hypothetical protein
MPKYKSIPKLTEEQIQHFWSCVDRSSGLGPNGDCWKWKQSLTQSGYGQYHINRKIFRAHRVALAISRGEMDPTKEACHTCNWPPCVRPDHLYPDTYEGNHAYKLEQHRQAHGLKHGRYTKPERTARGEQIGISKLTAHIVVRIKRLIRRGCSDTRIVEMVSRRYRITISPAAIWMIRNERSWKHIN